MNQTNSPAPGFKIFLSSKIWRRRRRNNAALPDDLKCTAINEWSLQRHESANDNAIDQTCAVCWPLFCQKKIKPKDYDKSYRLSKWSLNTDSTCNTSISSRQSERSTAGLDTYGKLSSETFGSNENQCNINDEVASSSWLSTDSFETCREEEMLEAADGESYAHLAPCECAHPCHYRLHDPEFPLRTNPSTQPGSYDETLSIANSMCGRWITLLERSQSLDTHFRLMGVNCIKRAIMNRLALPLTFFLEKDKTTLTIWLHTPLGIRTMTCDLNGQRSVEIDCDCGRWEGVAKMIDHSIPWYCGGTKVRALQQFRTNDRVGVMVDTKCVLPDAKEGKIMYYNLTLYPYNDPDNPISSDRILKYVGPGNV